MGEPQKPLEEMPILPDYLRDAVTAFFELDSLRQSPLTGPQPIGITDIEAYLEREGITDPEDCRDYLRWIRTLDKAYFKHLSEERREADKKAAKKRTKTDKEPADARNRR